MTVTIHSPQCPLGASEHRQGERRKEIAKKEGRGKRRKDGRGKEKRGRVRKWREEGKGGRKEKEGERKDKFWNQKTGILVWKSPPLVIS